jgi:hypothetical protein
MLSQLVQKHQSHGGLQPLCLPKLLQLLQVHKQLSLRELRLPYLL